MRARLVLSTVLATFTFTTAAGAQSWNADARAAGMGGIGGDENVFIAAADAHRGGRSIVLPLGLLQLLRDREIFDKRSPDFDPLRAVAYAANPMHLTFGGNGSREGAALVRDVRAGTVDRDLNAYRGFLPRSFAAGGTISPRWGHTFKVKGSTAHGVFVGAGPHLTLGTSVQVDASLASFLNAASPAYDANRQFQIGNRSTGQLGLAITGGYRGHFVLGGNGRNTAFLSANMNHLRGFRYEEVELALRMTTDAQGLLAARPTVPALSITRHTATSGAGHSVDLGAGVVAGPFELGFSGTGLGSQITWRHRSERKYSLQSLGSGAPFVVAAPVPLTDATVQTPATWRLNLGFRTGPTTVRSEVSHGVGGSTVRAGLEQRFGRLELRGAGTRVDNAWWPSAGVSVGVTRRVWADVSAFTTAVNVERQRNYALAASLRFQSKP